jgi:hypothetical protein
VYVGIQIKTAAVSGIVPKKKWLGCRIGDSMTEKFSSEITAGRYEKIASLADAQLTNYVP